MKKTLTSLAVGAACVAASIVQAAVPTGAVQSFNTRPLAVDWSTLNVPGAGNSIALLAAFDTAVNTNDIAIITNQVIAGVAAPAGNASAQWNPGGFLVTRPTGNAYTILMASLKNTSGSTLSGAIPVSYDLGLPNAFAGEDPEIGGLHAYYSFTGTPGSWVAIPDLTQVTPAAGGIAASVNFGSWPVNGSLYLIWVDDNGGPGTDGSYSIDNFIIGSTPPPPAIVTQPVGATNIQGRTFSLTVVANGSGLTYSWQGPAGTIDTTANPSAATATLVVTNAQLTDSGNYSVAITSPYGNVNSASAKVLIKPDTFAPQFISARFGTVANTIVLKLDEVLCDDLGCIPLNGTTASDGFTWDIINPNDLGDVVGVSAIVLQGTNLVFTANADLDVSKVYRVIMTGANGSVGDLYGNPIAAGAFADTLPLATAISVGAAGSALYTFDDGPSALEFSTFTWTGANTDAGDPVTLDAAAQALDVSLIIDRLADAAGDPPGTDNRARYATDTKNLITRPTGVLGNVILAHLRNDSGVNRPALTLNYTLRDRASGTAEEIPGHLVYYSFTGAPNTWVQIPGISNDGVPGEKSGALDFGPTPWVAGTMLYILFADDNAVGTEGIYEIDNFKLNIPATGVPPSITQSPASVSTNEGSIVHLNVVAAGSPPLAYQWLKGGVAVVDGGHISGATTARLTISDASAGDNGSYTCQVSNGTLPNALSGAALVTITPDTTRPVLTRAVGPNNTTVVLTFSKQLSAGAALTSHYTVSGATVSTAVLASNVVTLTTSARSVGISTLTITGVTDNRASANLINPNPTTVALTTVQVIDAWNSTWSYNTNNLDAAPTWTTTGGTGWETGNALFGTETSAGVIALFPTPIATVIPPNTNTPPDFVTAYFRKSVTLPALAAGTGYAITHFIDDGATFYINGAEIGRFNMTNGPVVYSTRATTANEATLNTLSFTAAAGARTLAVEVHQGGATTSSDMLFGAEVVAIPSPGPGLTVAQSGTNTVVSWTADSSWQLVGSTNVAGPYAVVAGAPFRTFTTPSTQASQFYQLRYNAQQ